MRSFPASELEQRLHHVVKAIPRGRVLPYSRVAILAGIPGAARQVGKAMAGLGKPGVPWWRVVRADLTLAEAVAPKQAKLLRAEGVPVKGRKVHSSARATLEEVSARL